MDFNEKSNSHIMCGVNSCAYNDKVNYCTLQSIVVGNTTFHNADAKEQTECASFKQSTIM